MNRLSPRASGQTAPLLLHILALTVLTRRAAVRIALPPPRAERQGALSLSVDKHGGEEEAKRVTPAPSLAFLTADCREHGAPEFCRRPASRWGDRRVSQTRV